MYLRAGDKCSEDHLNSSGRAVSEEDVVRFSRVTVALLYELRHALANRAHALAAHEHTSAYVSIRQHQLRRALANRADALAGALASVFELLYQ
jgi:hypothetical protein